MTAEMTPEVAAKLRDKFEIERIGKKPKITCGACSKSPSKVCGEHKKIRCDNPRAREGACGQYVTERHMHVEFVGHANVTDRLLSIDPEWTWEPMAFGQDGLPVLDANGGLWIRLTVAGVTRIGYGGADGKRGEDAVKEAIGDAIKVAAMRFGVGLDLWRKEEASGKLPDQPADPALSVTEPDRQRKPAERRPSPATEAMRGDPDKARGMVRRACDDNGWDLVVVADRFATEHGVSLRECTDPVAIEKFRQSLFRLPQATLQPAAAEAVNGAAR